MDFFATGGFQQLFSELNEDHLDTSADEIIENFYVQNYGCSITSDCKAFKVSDERQIIDEGEFRTSEIQFLNLNPVSTSKAHSLNDINTQYSDKVAQHWNGFGLPVINGDFTNEMADWEERFLENYIEIPELVEILPEKTPLCTNECELFLKESSKHLKLQRKQKSRNTDCDRSGYICTFGNCHKIYAKPAHLKAHLRRHLGEKPYVCNWPECTWKFSRSDELARHRRSHSGIKPYKCDYCTKCFARSDHLTKHRKVHERRILAASKAGQALDSILSYNILTVRPGRKRKNQIM